MRIFACSAEELVDEMICLSESERRAEMDAPADAFDRCIDT